MVKKLIIRNKKIIKQSIKFLLVGVLNTLVGYGVYFVLSYYIHYFFASIISSLTGITVSYILNRKWTFNVKKHSFKLMLKFYSIYAFSWLVYLGFISFFVEIIKFSPRLSGLIAIPISTFVTFIGQKTLVFKK